MMARKGSHGLLMAAATAAAMADQPEIKQVRKKRLAPVEDPDPSEEGLASNDEAGGTPVVKVYGSKKLRRHCDEEGCGKAAQGNSTKCAAHSGRERCSVADCSRSAAAGPTGLCIAHGGGKRCSVADCSRSAQAGPKGTCSAHGGGEGPRHHASNAHE